MPSTEILNFLLAESDKLNNDLSNLEWTNRRGNSKHYSEKLAPKYALERKKRKEDDLKARLTIIESAHNACTSNPELFHAIYGTVMNFK